jgi:transposase
LLAVTAVPPDDDLFMLAEVQGVLIEVLEARNGELAGRVAELEERLARLERAVSRNSGNSSMPPSADDLPGKAAPRPRPARGNGKRKQGKQPGAPGAHLAWSDDPDKTEQLFPQGECACGRSLAGAADLGVAASHQVIDTPAVTAAVTQYDGHTVACECGRLHTAPPPAGAGEAGTVTYGLNLQAWCVFLLVAHHVPVERCAGIIESLTGARPSDGWVHAMIARAAKAVRHVSMLIRALVITAAVLCADETPIRVGPGPKTRKKYLLVACTGLLTYYFLGGRSMETFDAFVFPDLSGSVLVHDRYQNYDAIAGVLHQLCCQHLLRDLEDAAQSYPDAVWPGQAADALRALIHTANTARAQGLAAAVPQRRPRRALGSPPRPRREQEAAAGPAAAGMPERPRGRRAPLPDGPADPAHLQPGRTRPAPREDPAEDLRAAPLRDRDGQPVRHPRLHLHRRETRRAHHHRHPRRPRRKPVDATHTRLRITPPADSHTTQAAITPRRWPECLLRNVTWCGSG